MYEIPATCKAAVDSILSEATEHLQFLLGDTVKAKLIVIQKQADIDLFRDLVCNEFNVTWKSLQTKDRKTELVWARFAFIYLCKLYTKLSDEEVMSMFNRERSSYYHSVEQAEAKLFVKDSYFYPKFQSIISQLNFNDATQTA